MAITPNTLNDMRKHRFYAILAAVFLGVVPVSAYFLYGYLTSSIYETPSEINLGGAIKGLTALMFVILSSLSVMSGLVFLVFAWNAKKRETAPSPASGPAPLLYRPLWRRPPFLILQILVGLTVIFVAYLELLKGLIVVFQFFDVSNLIGFTVGGIITVVGVVELLIRK